MNKKSIILSLLLCASLLTPQKTNPFGATLIITSAVYGAVLFNTCKKAETKNPLNNYVTEQNFIKDYTAHVQIYKKAQNRKTKTLIIDEIISTTTAAELITKIIQRSEGLRGKSRTFIHIDTTMTLHSNQKYPLAIIDKQIPSKQSLTKHLRKTLLMTEQPSSLKQIMRILFLSTGVVVIPMLFFAHTLVTLFSFIASPIPAGILGASYLAKI